MLRYTPPMLTRCAKCNQTLVAIDTQGRCPICGSQQDLEPTQPSQPTRKLKDSHSTTKRPLPKEPDTPRDKKGRFVSTWATKKEPAPPPGGGIARILMGSKEKPSRGTPGDFENSGSLNRCYHCQGVGHIQGRTCSICRGYGFLR